MDINKISFFFFGDWNKGACDQNVHLEKISNFLRANQKLYDFGVILGDNIYTENNKDDDPELVKRGIDCLNAIGKELYVVLGSRDVKNCDVITTETKTNAGWIFNSNYYSQIIRKENLSIKLVIIDTNLLTDNTIYTTISGCQLPENIKTDRSAMLNFIETELSDSSNYDWVIVAGHKPLVSFRNNGKSRPIANKHFESLYEQFSRYHNLIYISGGTHNFQYGKIINEKNTVLNQIISGTGGADPYPIIPEFLDGSFHKINDNYMVKLCGTYEPYGYSELILTKDKSVVVYHRISPDFEEHLFMVKK